MHLSCERKATHDEYLEVQGFDEGGLRQPMSLRSLMAVIVQGVCKPRHIDQLSCITQLRLEDPASLKTSVPSQTSLSAMPSYLQDDVPRSRHVAPVVRKSQIQHVEICV